MEYVISFISQFFYIYGVACGRVVGAMGLIALGIAFVQYLEVLYS